MPSLPERLSLRRWAALVGVSYSAARRATRRAIDPLPTTTWGRRLLVERRAAELWLSRQQRRSNLDLARIVNDILRDLRPEARA